MQVNICFAFLGYIFWNIGQMFFMMKEFSLNRDFRIQLQQNDASRLLYVHE